MSLREMKTLDYEIAELFDHWEVWTPRWGDKACIGCGHSKTAALRDAIARLEGVLPELREELRKTLE